jgi:acyl carrier protein
MGERAPLDKFRVEIAEILEIEPDEVSPDSRLVEDLDFDSLAFVELGILLLERYGSQNFMSAIADEIDARTLTVGSVFANYASGLVAPP